jgi:hypothetical protein
MSVSGKKNNAPKIFSILIASVLASVLLLAMFFFKKGELSLGMPVLVLPFIIVFITAIFIDPRLGFLAAIIANYFALGIARYVPAPMGLTVDVFLVLTWLAVFFSQFNKKIKWEKAWNGFTVVAIIWFLYTVFQLFNPEAVSRIAWFYAMRGISLYMLLVIPIVYILFDKRKYLEKMLSIWAWFTLAAVAKGAMQKIIGPDPWEQYWLDTVGGITHLLSQGLRVFSFFSDAATYGGSMAFSAVVFSIVGFHTNNQKKKYFFYFVCCAAFYAMLISGTRGAIAVPFAGYALYAVLSRKIKILIIGAILGATVFGFLKFTTIGNSVYEIRRFRGGIDSNNASLVVRKENKKLLTTYLADKPFGGGIGSAGNWGMRFSPGTFLADTPTDSWYVQIWAEQGRVGLVLHLFVLFYILLKCSYITMFRLKDPELKGRGAAFCAGMFGVMAASYGSSALGQMPNGIIIYINMSFILIMQKWENELEAKKLIND